MSEQPPKRTAADIFRDAHEALTLPTASGSDQFDGDAATARGAEQQRQQDEAAERLRGMTVRIGQQP